MRKIIFNCLMGIDNKYLRFFSAIGFLVYFLNSFLAINEPWDPIKYSEGFGILIVTISTGLRIKNDKEV